MSTLQVTSNSSFEMVKHSMTAVSKDETADIGALPTPSYSEAYATIWGLGKEEWWKELIDGDCHQYGPYVFDKGLHGGNVEEGYLASLHTAFEMVSSPSCLMEDPSVKLYQDLNKVACRHFKGKSTNTFADQDTIGTFVLPIKGKEGRCCNGSKTYLFPQESFPGRKEAFYYKYACYHFLKDFVAYTMSGQEVSSGEFETLLEIFKKKHSGYFEKMFKGRSTVTPKDFEEEYYKAISWLKTFDQLVISKLEKVNSVIAEKSILFGMTRPIAVIRQLTPKDPRPDPLNVRISYNAQDNLDICVQIFFDQYNQKMKTATTKDEKLRNIAELYQMLEWLHPFADGQGRTDLLLLTKELCKHGFTPAILENPYASTWCTLEEWIDYLKLGMERWQKEQARIRAASAPTVSLEDSRAKA